ncbi:Gfo/Idh/MocA family protein [Sinomicrobium weinanense]|uniref:Gfo/Idh/MocA family oxidoreductase n=1 Tax=Sinomicrobium weinanense TaxID=2842200 RepID=A0A926Q0D9_9FLAO|nr:Gfo/Idh/MocA family oxidoreductase [Sinomicrobium weinanense]MBC9794738.1 Gfo/Idh/MocA family oxidoreductase [Sinomicrobium weinanense]MBU3124997.1 Gfo/Idh/MocA family oxidoreductase [Sinomicrobium weinanense]
MKRRKFIKNSALATAGLTTMSTMGFTAQSYNRIIGANDRLNIAIMGLGRRLGAYVPPISRKESNVELLYLCDVMKSQREKAATRFAEHLDYNPKLENSILKILEDKKVDAIINATPDHWHGPGTWLAVEAGKHVYVEKPCCHNPKEGELLVAYQKKYNKVIQMGNQQRSAEPSIEIINEIHNGAIGNPYLAVAHYANSRGEVIVPKKAPVPDGLDWDLFQGPAPRRAYTHDTWDYNWHWYGWDFGTAETGNNATHELDIARWALQVEFPNKVMVNAEKRHWPEDGWSMYDTMDATFEFGDDKKTIKWDGKSRNGYNTYGKGRGTIIYGTEGTVFVDREGYELYDRSGKLIKERKSEGGEAGTQLGGGGDISTTHMVNFFETIRGKEKQRSPIDEGAKSTLLCHLANMAYRTGETLECDPRNGHITNSQKGQALWGRTYEPGWEPQQLV